MLKLMMALELVTSRVSGGFLMGQWRDRIDSDEVVDAKNLAYYNVGVGS